MHAQEERKNMCFVSQNSEGFTVKRIDVGCFGS